MNINKYSKIVLKANEEQLKILIKTGKCRYNINFSYFIKLHHLIFVYMLNYM